MIDKRIYKIMIVDDHPVMRKGLSEVLLSCEQFEICGEADGQSAALELLKNIRPNLIIIDITLKEGSGIELIKQIKASDRSLKMLVVSMHEESLYAERALRAGAKGYLTKQQASSKIIDASIAVLNDKIYVSEDMSQIMMERLIGGETETAENRINVLTNRELEIFEHMGHGKDIKEIAKLLGLSFRTIEAHRTNIMAKFRLKKASELVKEAIYWIQVEKIAR